MIRTAALLLLAAAAANASSTTAWEMSTYQDFLKGRFSGLSLTRDGRVMLAPKADVLFSSDQPSVWSVVQAPDQTIYLATGNRGRVYSIDKAGKTALVWTSPQPEVFALAVGPDGALYAGSSPDGKIFRVTGGKAEEYFNPQAKYIWALAFGSDGALYAGTGDGGRIYRITAPGQGGVYYDTGQSHITCLAFDKQGALLAGSEPNGIIYRVTAPERAFVLYDASLPEIRSLSVGPDGSVYAAALGGSIAQRTAAATAATATAAGSTPVTAPGTSITVTEDNAQAGAEFKPKVDQQKGTASSVVSPITTQTIEVTGVEKSALYRINGDNTVETLWSSKDENAYDLLLSGNQVLFSTDAQGRVYRLGADRRVTLLTQTNEGEATRLLASREGKLLVATSTLGKLLQLSEKQDSTGTYESPVHDASGVARWGQLSWRGEKGPNSRLLFRTRSGNSARPDRTWSDWSEPLVEPRGSTIPSPNARFIQWKTEFASNTSETPSITGVTLAYLPQNNPPAVHAINVSTQLAATTNAKTAAQTTSSSSAAYSITVTDTGESGASTLSGTSTQSVARGITQQILISWAADDPDADRLVYGLYFRGEDEKQWKLLRGNFAESSLTLEGDVFADGKYFFRVVASDRPSNAASSAREADLISAPVLFDSTPPVLRAGTPRRTGPKFELDLEASDSTSALRRAEYSLDASAWVPLEAEDGIIDGREEKFHLRLDSLAAGEHLVVVRVFDSSNNAGLTKVVVE
jgi:hypothetical protein